MSEKKAPKAEISLPRELVEKVRPELVALGGALAEQGVKMLLNGGLRRWSGPAPVKPKKVKKDKVKTAAKASTIEVP